MSHLYCSNYVFICTIILYIFFFFSFPQAETNEIKEIVNSINDVIDPISQEFESDNEAIILHERNDYLDDQMVGIRVFRFYLDKLSTW